MTKLLNLNELLEYAPEIEKTDIFLDDNLEYEIFEDLEAYAEYELFDGYYQYDDSIRIMNGAPNPLLFVDLKKFGEELSNEWDLSYNAILASGEVVKAF